MQSSPTKIFKPSSPSLHEPHPNGRYIQSRQSLPQISIFADSLPSISFSTLLQQSLTHPASLFSSHQVTSPATPITFPKKPYKVLDAPDLVDDFFYSLIDWGKNNTISVGLSRKLYLYSVSTGKVALLNSGDQEFSAVRFSESAELLAGCLADGQTIVFDVNKQKETLRYHSHKGRVGVARWKGGVLSTGGNDCYIIHSDLRAPQEFCRFRGQTSEVCGMEWGETDLASGGSEGQLKIWESFGPQERFSIKAHNSALKAMAWSAYDSQKLLTGGGSADHMLRSWNSNTAECIDSVDAGSQVCGILCSLNSKEIISVHGGSSEVYVWSIEGLKMKSAFKAHEDRVAYMSLSPTGTEIITAGEKTLKFWNVFNKTQKRHQVDEVFSKSLR